MVASTNPSTTGSCRGSCRPTTCRRISAVTLRRLLSHNAGTTVHGFPGYAVGAPVPTVVQVLDGEPPANTAPVRVDLVPGSKVRYSGGGTTIVQLMMTDQLKKPFPEIMAETVLGPLGMTHSSYEQPLPAGRAAMTATGTRRGGQVVEGRWHIYPEMAAAGLWTTPSDLARVAIEVSLAHAGTSSRVLSQAMTRQMLTPQAEDFGLGFAVDPEDDAFGHNGADEGFPGVPEGVCRLGSWRGDHGQLRQRLCDLQSPGRQHRPGVRLEGAGGGRRPAVGDGGPAGETPGHRARARLVPRGTRQAASSGLVPRT